MGISLQDATSLVTDNAIRTQYGLILPPGARVAAYVRSTGVQSGDDGFLVGNLVTTLAAGLARVRPGLGDFVVCLPGHVENVTDGTTFSNALIAGTKIIGVGSGSNTPTFTWTATASQWSVAVADVVITGLRLLMDGISGVVNAINVAAADFKFYFNDVECSTTAKASVTCLTMAAGAARFDISGNTFRGLASVPVTVSIINVAGSVAGGRICDNEFMCPCQTAGQVFVTQTATELRVLRNVMNNTVAASTACINYANFAITGQCAYNTLCVLAAGAQTTGVTGIVVGGTNNLTGFFQNFVVNDSSKSGVLQPVVDT